MTATHVLEREQFIPRPLSEVFDFFADAANLEALTPASLKFRIESTRPINVQAGTIIEYRLRLSGVPFRWKTLIEEFTPGVSFVDVQLRGPYRLWRHTHRFRETDGGTLVHDRVEYQLPLGPLGTIAHGLFVRRSLRKIFDFRRERLEELFPATETIEGSIK